jgi:hypothetical protein
MPFSAALAVLLGGLLFLALVILTLTLAIAHPAYRLMGADGADGGSETAGGRWQGEDTSRDAAGGRWQINGGRWA